MLQGPELEHGLMRDGGAVAAKLQGEGGGFLCALWLPHGARGWGLLSLGEREWGAATRQRRLWLWVEGVGKI